MITFVIKHFFFLYKYISFVFNFKISFFFSFISFLFHHFLFSSYYPKLFLITSPALTLFWIPFLTSFFITFFQLVVLYSCIHIFSQPSSLQPKIFFSFPYLYRSLFKLSLAFLLFHHLVCYHIAFSSHIFSLLCWLAVLFYIFPASHLHITIIQCQTVTKSTD